MKIRVFTDVAGYYSCPADGPLDTRGPVSPTKAAATRLAIETAYDPETFRQVPPDEIVLVGSGVCRRTAYRLGAHVSSR